MPFVNPNEGGPAMIEYERDCTIVSERELNQLKELWEISTKEDNPLLTLILGNKGIGKNTLIKKFISDCRISKEQIIRLKWAGIFDNAFIPFEKPLNIKYDSIFSFHKDIGLPSFSRLSTATIGYVPALGKILMPIYDEWLKKREINPQSQVNCFNKLAKEIIKKSSKKPVLIIIHNMENIPETAVKFFRYFIEYPAKNILICSIVDTNNKYSIPDNLQILIRSSKITKIKIPYINEKDIKPLLIAGLEKKKVSLGEKTDEIINFIININKSDYIVPGKIIEIIEILKEYGDREIQEIKHIIESHIGEPLSLLKGNERRILELLSYFHENGIEVSKIKNFRRILSYWGIAPREYDIGIMRLEKYGFINKHVIESAYEKIDNNIREIDHQFLSNMLMKYLKFQKNEDYNLHILIASHLEKTGDYEKACDFYFHTAIKRMDNNENDEACKLFARALECTDAIRNKIEIKFYLAVTLYKLGKTTESEKELNELIEILNNKSENENYIKILTNEVEFYKGLITSHCKRDFKKGAEIFEKLISEATGELKALAKIEMAWCIHKKDPLDAQRLLEEALECDTLNQSVKATGHHYKAILLKENKRDMNAMMDAEEELKEALRLAEDDVFLTAQIYDTLGNLYSQMGKKKEAISSLSKSVIFKKEIQDMEGLAISYGGLARARLRAGEYEKARENYYDDLNLIEQLNPEEWRNKCQIYNEIAETFRFEKNFDDAHKFIKKSINCLPGNIKDDGLFHDLGYIYLTEAKILCDQGKKNEALQQCKEAEEYLQGNLHIMPEVYLTLGKIYHKKKDLEKAMDYFKEAEKNLEFFDLQFLYSEMGMVEEKRGNVQIAEGYFCEAEKYKKTCSGNS